MDLHPPPRTDQGAAHVSEKSHLSLYIKQTKRKAKAKLPRVKNETRERKTEVEKVGRKEKCNEKWISLHCYYYLESQKKVIQEHETYAGRLTSFKAGGDKKKKIKGDG